jgi:hypothetical protein
MAATVRFRSVSEVIPLPTRSMKLGVIGLVLATPSVTARPLCEYEHTSLGNLPKEKEPGWYMEAQGLDHDDSRWFISHLPRSIFPLSLPAIPDKCALIFRQTQPNILSCVNPTLWRIPLGVNLSQDVECGDLETSGPNDTVCARQLRDQGHERNASSSWGMYFTTQRLMVECSTKTPRARRSASTWRVLKGYATYQRTPISMISRGNGPP